MSKFEDTHYRARSLPTVIEASPPEHAKAGFLHSLALAPGPAFATVIANLMLEPLYVGSMGLALPVGLFVAAGLAYYCYQMQLQAGDASGSARAKAALIFVLTAAPVPLSPLLIPAGIAGLISRWKNRRG